jgi:hypothetical protein
MSFRNLTLSMLLLAPLAAPAFAEDKPATKKIDNPTYASWSKFKAGTVAKYENDSGMAGQKMTMTHTLIEVTAEKVVIETKMTTTVGGQTMDLPAQRRDELKTIEVPNLPPSEEKKPETKEGTGDVTVPAGTFSTKWVETTVTTNGMTVTSKVWQSDAVPGNVVKMESTMPNPMGGGEMKTSMVLIELKKA